MEHITWYKVAPFLYLAIVYETIWSVGLDNIELRKSMPVRHGYHSDARQ